MTGLASRCLGLGKGGVGLIRCGVRSLERRLRDVRGQSTVEAAVMIPLLFGGMLMLLQPGILLYDRVVMEGAAAEGCRVLATASGGQSDQVRAYVKRRLGAIPPQSSFHLHEGSCSWQIDLTGDESSDRVVVEVKTKARPLPLLDFGLGLLGILDGDGCLTVRVRVEQPTQPSWSFGSSAGSDASAWVGAWMDQ
ncbi:MAG: TadE/TadG family type IV pilus assembly protein [Eggerthellales bacterium]|nr:TadE/TadG family type IV pilus assembly protein [Eggerthellales bacterium]